MIRCLNNHFVFTSTLFMLLFAIAEMEVCASQSVRSRASASDDSSSNTQILRLRLQKAASWSVWFCLAFTVSLKALPGVNPGVTVAGIDIDS